LPARPGGTKVARASTKVQLPVAGSGAQALKIYQKGEPGMSNQRIPKTLFLAAGLALAACASTSLVETWKAPGAGPLRFNKVLALAVVENESIRSAAEDALRAHLRSVQAVQSYTLFGIKELADRERLKERLRQDGFDGVVALRLASSQQSAGWTSSAVPLEAFWGSYGYGAYPPAEMRVDTVVRVEINVYSLAEDKLIWTGVSESFNPQSAPQLVADIVAAAGKELRRQGLISA
jgi:hypothetical protein